MSESKYALNEDSNNDLSGVSAAARGAAIAAANKEDASFLRWIPHDLKPVVLEGATAEFYGYKEQGNRNPVTITGVVFNGQAIEFEKPLVVEFQQKGAHRGELTPEFEGQLDALVKGYEAAAAQKAKLAAAAEKPAEPAPEIKFTPPSPSQVQVR